MRTLIVCCFLFLAACEAPSGDTAAPTMDPATNPAFSAQPPVDLTAIIGTWNPMLANGTLQWCAQDATTLEWTCAPASPPDACTPVWPLIDGYSVLGAGIQFDGASLLFSTPQTPAYDPATGIISLSPSGLQWGVVEHEGKAILSYGAGCNLLLEKN